MDTTPNSVLVADYLIANAGGRLTPLQVIKMAYIAHGYSLAIFDEPLVGEAVEAWRYGPVVPSVYHCAKKYGGSKIAALLYSGIETDDTAGVAGAKKFFEERILLGHRTVLDGVLDSYGKFTGIELTRMTHADGSPWRAYYRPNEMGRVIPDGAIRAHYKGLIGNSAA